VIPKSVTAWKYVTAAVAVLALNACGSPYYTADPIEAWVVDAETDQPIEGAVVTANWQLVAASFDTGGRKLRQLKVMETVTDKNGRFTFPGFTKLNLSLDELRDEDPQILIFKSGYRYFRTSHDHDTRKPSPVAHRSSPLVEKNVRLERADSSPQKAAQQLLFLAVALDKIWNSSDGERIPRMTAALACERKRLLAIDPRAGFSVTGATGTETNCEKP